MADQVPQRLRISWAPAGLAWPDLVVAALQPGTVRSALSRPFVGDAAMDPAESAQRLLAVLDGLPATGRAHFVDHQGQAIPW